MYNNFSYLEAGIFILSQATAKMRKLYCELNSSRVEIVRCRESWTMETGRAPQNVWLDFPSDSFTPAKSKRLSYRDVSSEKLSLPGSGVVVGAAVVVTSSALMNLKLIATMASKMMAWPFIDKLLNFIADDLNHFFYDFSLDAPGRGYIHSRMLLCFYRWQNSICKWLFAQFLGAGALIVFGERLVRCSEMNSNDIFPSRTRRWHEFSMHFVVTVFSC